MKRLAIAGCGKLGGIVVDAMIKGLLPEYELVGVYSRTEDRAIMLAGKANEQGMDCQVADSFEELLALKPDYLVEAASPAAMRQWAVPALKNGTSIVTLSIGAFADDAFYAEAMEVAKENGTHIYIVSGATGGFDILQTATLMGGATAKFFNEKGPNGLRGTSVYDDDEYYLYGLGEEEVETVLTIHGIFTGHIDCSTLFVISPSANAVMLETHS